METKLRNADTDYAALLKELSQLSIKTMEPHDIVQIYGKIELILSDLSEELQCNEILTLTEAFKSFQKQIYAEIRSRGLDIEVKVIDNYQLNDHNFDAFSKMVYYADNYALLKLLFKLEKLSEESDKYQDALEIIYQEFIERAEESGASC